MTDPIDPLGLLRAGFDAAETLIRRLTRELAMANADIGSKSGVDAVVWQGSGGADVGEVRVRRQLAALDASFAEDIVEPPGSGAAAIDRRIRTDLGLGWSWEAEYTRNGQFAWCGAEAAVGLRAAGIKDAIATKVLPSCYRLHQFCGVDDPDRRRVVALADARPGDIVVVGSASSRGWGAHITTCLAVDMLGRRLHLHEGNAMARGPRGDIREGVGRQWRSLDRSAPSDYVPMHIYRFLDADFGQE